ncbi:MAG: ammonium transporter [Pseudanabaenaceae cyanobacterium]
MLSARSFSRRKLQRSKVNWRVCLPFAALIGVFWVYAAGAQDSPTPEQMMADLKVGLDTLWVVVAAFLVFFMNAGFGLVESGFCRRKNAVNILAKNLIVFAIATVAFWMVGFAFMFGDGNAFIGLQGFFLTGQDNSPAQGNAYKGVFSALNWTGVPLQAKFLFQLAFAGTAATIVSGAVAERIKFVAFLLFSFLLVAISYAITGHWVWGGGWLAGIGFWDFAGSTVVHSVGGWAALVGAGLLGPRLGRYGEDGSVRAFPGHNMTSATLGCLILWLGWFGFNPGSTMALDGRLIAHIALTTNLAAATGGLAATVTAWLALRKPDLSMIINGILAGLVAITAPCAYVTLPAAALIGIIAGILVVFAVGFFDRIKIDDPVGATSVHLVCGIWGTLAVGLFAVGPKADIGNDFILQAGTGPARGFLLGGGLDALIPQIVGILTVGAFTTIFSFVAWLAIAAVTGGLRVEKEEELKGLDVGEHGMEAYSGFALETIE